MTLDMLTAYLAVRCLACTVTPTPCGGTSLTFAYGVLIRLHNSHEWHWSTVRSHTTSAGEGSFHGQDGCMQFLRHLRPLPGQAPG
jgi:hypothetical protein